MQRNSVSIDGNGAFALTGATDGNNSATGFWKLCDQFPGRLKKGLPPLQWVLFYADVLHKVQGDRAKCPGQNIPRLIHECAFAAGGPKIHRKHEIVERAEFHIQVRSRPC